MENIKLSWKAGELVKGKEGIFSAVWQDGFLTVKIFFDFHENPLTLTAPALAEDHIELTFYRARLALTVNGQLWDEEWPCGNCLLCPEDVVAPLTLTAVEPESLTRQPSVIREGLSLGELRSRGINMGDCMPYADEAVADGVYHLFYLYDRHHHGSKWGMGAHQWSHISTKDFQKWQEHPMAIQITEPWEGSICTGSVCYLGDKYYAWYAVRMSDRSPARMTYAVSKDLTHFEKSGIYFTLPARYEQTSARDPKPVMLDGVLHVFITTTLMENGHGCLAHLVANPEDITQFIDCGPILEWETGDQPECPDWFKMGQWYYLVYSIDAKARYVYSKSPFDGWIRPEEDGIPCGCVPKSALWGDRRIFTGFVGENGYAGHLVFAEALQNDDGTLRFVDMNV